MEMFIWTKGKTFLILETVIPFVYPTRTLSKEIILNRWEFEERYRQAADDERVSHKM